MMHRLAWLLAAPLAFVLGPLGHANKQADKDPTRREPPPFLLRSPVASKTHIVFGYADDLWIVSRQGGEARRLTNGPGVESDPAFSPDGKFVAFSGQYDGNQDVYVVSATGGSPKRLTYHPGNDQAVTWTPDSKRVVFRSARISQSRYLQLFSVSVEGGLPEALPLPMADHGSYSPDGKKLAYVPFINGSRNLQSNVPWKQYKGGRQPFVWIADLADSSVTAVPRNRSNDTCPMWVGDKVYFLSDRDGRTTLFHYDTQTKKVERALDPGDSDIRSASLSASHDAIVYEKPGGVHLYDLGSAKSNFVPITIEADLPGTRTRFVNLAEKVSKASLSPTGARVLVEARGEIFTVPVSKGDARNLTESSGVAERDPSWSPDGKWIAYFSDASGEYELHLRPQDGRGKVKVHKLPNPSFYYGPNWSPDSAQIAFTDARLNLWVMNVANGKTTKIDANPYADGRIGGPSWSPDSQWLAYTKQLKSHLSAVFLHSRSSGKSHQLTDNMSDASSPQFDKGGKYLYFSASTDVGHTRGSGMSAINRPISRSLYLVVLSSEDPSPFAPESDEEKDEAKKEDKKDEKKDKPAAKPKTRIDLDDIDQRILALPVPTRNYVGLAAGKAGQLWMVEAPELIRQEPTFMSTPPTMTLHRFDLTKRKAEKWVDGVMGVSFSNNGEKLLYRQGKSWAVVSTAAQPKPGEGTLSLSGVEMRLDPVAEWRQMYREVWRLERDFLYDPGAHGMDLKAAAKKYEAYLPTIASRYDLSYLFDEMLGDLALGHVYVQGGDSPSVSGPKGGLLGADFKVEEGRYRFAKIYRGENWNPELRAPLTQPGARVREGEFLLAINDNDLKDTDNVHRLLEGKAGKTVTLKVGPNADGRESREVRVTPVASDANLRHFDWISENRRKVEKATDGKIAYIYLPNTSSAGYTRFVREFYAQVNKDGVIIDERFNGGGQLADQVIDALNQKPRNYITTRHGEDYVMPRGIFGPKVMLINEAAGSGGDYLPYTFRQAKLGKLVGKRTWGGLVGIGGYPPLVDGGSVTAPHWALWFPNGKWDVENIGVPPDVEVEMDPKLVRLGKDPQLEKAIEIALDELKKNPPQRPSRPEFPNYHRKNANANEAKSATRE